MPWGMEMTPFIFWGTKNFLLGVRKQATFCRWETGVRGEAKVQERRRGRERLLRKMEQVANCRVNDAVKLAFLEGQWPEQIDGMELTALTELKRSGNGTVEMKFVNRVAVLERLLELTNGGNNEKAEAFFRALEQHVERGDGGGV